MWPSHTCATLSAENTQYAVHTQKVTELPPLKALTHRLPLPCTCMQRCTPERWQVLVDLLSQGLACSGITAFADLRRNEWRPRLIMWLTAYLLMEEQYGSAAAEQGGGTAAQQGDAGEGNPAAAAGAAAAGPAAGQSSGAGAADSSVAAAELAAEQGAGAQVVPLPVALLPMEFLHCCVAEALETRRTAPAVFSHQHRMAAKVGRLGQGAGSV